MVLKVMRGTALWPAAVQMVKGHALSAACGRLALHL